MLFLGASKIDITPPHPVPLAGFAARRELGPYEAVMRPLYARTLLLQHRDERGNKTSAAIVSADLLWWGSDRAPELKKRIQERCDAGEVILTATHTHSGPQTSDRFTASLGDPDMAYITYLEERVLEGVSLAEQGMEPVTMERGKGRSPIGIHRRISKEGAIEFGPNASGPVDHDLSVIRFMAAGDRVKAALVHYACHPVTTADNVVSSEFTGVAMERLESTLGEGTVAAFLQGMCGDINPSIVQPFCSGSDAEVGRIGEMLADDVLQALSAKLTPLTPVPIRSRVVRLPLPLQRLPMREELEALQSNSGVMGEWSRLLLGNPHRISGALELEMTRLTLAAELALLTVNAEAVVEYGLYAKALSGDRVLPMGYCNGMIGYVPTRKQLIEGGYEALESTFYFGIPAPLQQSVEERMREAIDELCSDLNERV